MVKEQIEVIDKTKEEIDYDAKQYIQLGYKTKGSNYISFDGYNTSEKSHITGIHLDHYKELPFDDIESIQVLIVGNYDYISIVGFLSIKIPIYIISIMETRSNTLIDSLNVDNADYLKVALNVSGGLFCSNVRIIDISDSSVGSFAATNCTQILLNECTIYKVLMYCDKEISTDGECSNIDRLFIKQCNIDQLIIRQYIDDAELIESTIRMYSQYTKIGNYSENFSNINPISILNRSKFGILTKDSCRLGLKSAKLSNDLDLYIEFNELLMDIEKINSSRWKRVSYWYLNATTGYGFKPVKALWFSLGVILFFASVYGVIDLIRGKLSIIIINSLEDLRITIMTVAKYVYQSGITYTTIGFTDILEVNPLIGLLYVFEAILGISVLSLFIFSLTRKYFFGK